MEKICPTHFDHGITPNDTTCHSHESITQQCIHNFHCRQLKCPHALNGVKKHDDVPVFPSRNIIEILLKKGDPITKKIFKVQ